MDDFHDAEEFSQGTNEEVHKPTYISKDGFVQTPIIRGGTEVTPLYFKANLFGGIICGGYARWMCSPADQVVPAGDVDVYFPSESGFEGMKQSLLNELLTIKHENDISVTFALADEDSKFRGCPSIQLIKPIKEGRVVAIGSMEDILSNFDFTVVRAGMVDRDFCMVDADFMHDERSKILRLKNIHCPVGSTLRCMKYSKKGYWLPPLQSLQLFFDWDNRDDSYKIKLIEFVTTANNGHGLTQKEIDEMESMMRID